MEEPGIFFSQLALSGRGREVGWGRVSVDDPSWEKREEGEFRELMWLTLAQRVNDGDVVVVAHIHGTLLADDDDDDDDDDDGYEESRSFDLLELLLILKQKHLRSVPLGLSKQSPHGWIEVCCLQWLRKKIKNYYSIVLQ